MRFQESRLHGDDAVIGRMAAVKSVTRELFPVAINGRGDGFLHAFGSRACDKFRAVLLNLFGFFLRDGGA